MSLHQSSGQWRLGLALSLLTVLLWGVLPVALTITLQKLDVYTVTWFRFLCAFGLLAVYLGGRGQLPSWARLKAASWGLMAIATLFLAINYLLFLQGLAQTSAANAQVLIQLAPVLMGLGAIAVFKERYTLKQWFGLGLLTLGFSLFFHEQLQNLIVSTDQYLMGSGLLMVAAAAWAVYALAQKQLLQKLPSSAIMLTIYGGCSLLFSPIASPQRLLTLSPFDWGVLLFCALNTLIAYGAFAEALEHWEASRVSAVLSLTPIVTISVVLGLSVLLPTLMTPEHLTVLGLIGAILVVAGSFTIALGKAQTH